MKSTMQIKDGRTYVIQDEVERCEDIDDLRLILDNNSQYFVDWKAFINYLVNTGGYSYSQFARQCGMSRNTIVTWCEKGIQPRSRNQFIQLGFGAKMSLKTMNEFLQRYGKYPRLYSKNIEDAIYIFALNQGMTYKMAASLQDQFDYIIGEIANSNARNNMQIPYNETMQFQSQLLSLNDIKQFEGFITENITTFTSSNEKLVSFIDAYIKINTFEFTGADTEESLNGFLETKIRNPKIVNHYNKLISSLRNYRVVPKRNALIAFGVYLDMSLGDVNQMLSMAGMEPLCAKDKIECVIIYAIESAILNNPDIEFSNALLLNNFSDDPTLKANCRKIISRYEINPYKSADDDGGVMKYVLEALRQIEREDVSELSSLFEQTA